MIHYFRVRGPEKPPKGAIYTAQNYQQSSFAALDPDVLDLTWNVIDYGSGTVNITLTTLSQGLTTWNNVPYRLIDETIKGAYKRETAPVAVDMSQHQLQNDLLSGIGLRAQHRLLNANGAVITGYSRNMLEQVQRVNVDIYGLTTMAVNGLWYDFHRLGRDDLEPGPRVSYQYWETTGPQGVLVPESGYKITKTVEETGRYRRKVEIIKLPSAASIRGVNAQHVFGRGARFTRARPPWARSSRYTRATFSSISCLS